MNHVPRQDPHADEVARIRAVVARHRLPDFVSGFDVRLWEFDGSPILSIVFRTIDEAGRSVDVTLADGHYGRLNDMGTDFDDFTPRSRAYASEGITAAQQANRARLRDALQAGGFGGYSGEWWHFDGPGAKDPRPILDVPVN